MEDAARLIAQQDATPLPFTPDYVPLAAAPAAGTVVAVDGSEAVLVDNGSVWVVAVRAVALPWHPSGSNTEKGTGPMHPPPTRSVPLPVEPTVHAAAPDRAGDVLGPIYQALGLETPVVRTAEAFAEALRAAAEVRVSLSALREMGRDDLLLVDGALENLHPKARRAAALLVETAATRGVGIAGVAKQSRLVDAGVPLVHALQRDGPPGAWSVRVRDYQMAHVARLHARSPFAFRIDVDDAKRLPVLADLARDAVYLGYPYPLAAVHNAVAIRGSESRALRARLINEVTVHAGPGAYRLLDDFHAVLDANTP